MIHRRRVFPGYTSLLTHLLTGRNSWWQPVEASFPAHPLTHPDIALRPSFCRSVTYPSVVCFPFCEISSSPISTLPRISLPYGAIISSHTLCRGILLRFYPLIVSRNRRHSRTDDSEKHLEYKYQSASCYITLHWLSLSSVRRQKAVVIESDTFWSLSLKILFDWF